MSYVLSMTKESRFLHVHVRGKRTREAVLKMSMEILEACRQGPATRVLIDVRDLTGRLDMLDAFEVPAFEFPKLRTASPLQKAVVVDLPEFESQFRFFESVARNRGFNFRIFGNSEEAEAWLLEEASSGANPAGNSARSSA